jgi:hypothetical protein
MNASRGRFTLLTSLTLGVVFCLGTIAAADNTAENAAAQNASASGGNAVTGNTVTLPGTNLPGAQRNLTPEQMKTIMAYRYLQSRGGGGRGQVQRGVPQFIPFGSLGYGNGPQDAQAQQAGGADPTAAPASDRDAKKEAAKQKRIEALKAAAEKKKAAREARAQQRKAQQGQDPVAGAK